MLLVGDTGAGKTTVCQLLGLLLHTPLRILNCHAHTETADFIGGYRPTRAAGAPPFAWVDGPLLTSMRDGGLLLLDELSLAQDGVLERLNSVLETGRSITLAERGSEAAGGCGAELVVAAASWRLLATMNPGGDFGKRELSPALRNRFTEIWVPALTARDELRLLLAPRLAHDVALQPLADVLADFWCVSPPWSLSGSVVARMRRCSVRTHARVWLLSVGQPWLVGCVDDDTRSGVSQNIRSPTHRAFAAPCVGAPV